MNIYESISSAITSILGNKMRSILTMVGIIVGVSSVITISAVGQGFQKFVSNEFSAFGLDNVELYLSGGGELTEKDYLTYEDTELIEKIPGVAGVTPITNITLNESVYLRNPDKAKDASIYGVSEDYFDIKNKEIIFGRTLIKQDLEFENSVAVINSGLALEVFGFENAVGETLSIKTWYGEENFTVVGIYKPDENFLLQSMYERPTEIYIPSPVLKYMLGGNEIIGYIVFKVEDRTASGAIADQAVRLLSVKHENTDTYTAFVMSSELDSINSVILIFTMFVGVVAAISLLVGSIGVMNIMLVSVTERTREIGIRKSLGATEGNIRFQFLVESIIITAIGGLTGAVLGYFFSVLIGVGATIALSLQTQVYPVFSFSMILISVFISAFIGVISGVYPASKAAKLNAIDALRYE